MLKLCLNFLFNITGTNQIKKVSFDAVNYRLEYSDFFGQLTRGKMKIRLEKSAVNFLNPAGGKNEKTRQRTLHEKLWLDFYFFTGKNVWISK